MKRRLTILQRHLTAAPLFDLPPLNATYASETHPCYFPSSSYLQVPVVAIHSHTHNSQIITFGLPSGRALNHAVSSCIMLQDRNGNSKPYNPISSPTHVGSFSLLIKHSSEGTVSAFAGTLTLGDRVGFCQFKGNIKSFQYPFDDVTQITMLATGTGITPLYQALVLLMDNTRSNPIQVRLISGNATLGDVLLRKELLAMAASSNGRLAVTFVVGSCSNTKTNKERTGTMEKGWIDEEKVKRLAFSSLDPHSIVWICGTPSFYTAMAGSRFDPLTLDSVLFRLGYTDEQVWRS